MHIFLGLLHLGMGLVNLLFGAWSYFYGEPQLHKFYQDADITYRTGLIPYLRLFIAGSINFYFAQKLLTKKQEKLLFIASSLFLVLSFFLFFFFGFFKYSNVGNPFTLDF